MQLYAVVSRRVSFQGLRLELVDRAISLRIIQEGIDTDFSTIVEQGCERLVDLPDLGQGIAQLQVPILIVLLKIFGAELSAAAIMRTLQVHRLCQVEEAVLIGDFLTGLNVTNGNFKAIAGAHGVAVAAMIDILGEVPADNTVPAFVNVGILLNSGLHFGIMIPVGVRADLHFQAVFDVGNGAFGQKPGSKYTIAFVVVDVLQLSMRMDHCLE